MSKLEHSQHHMRPSLTHTPAWMLAAWCWFNSVRPITRLSSATSLEHGNVIGGENSVSDENTYLTYLPRANYHNCRDSRMWWSIKSTQGQGFADRKWSEANPIWTPSIVSENVRETVIWRRPLVVIPMPKGNSLWQAATLHFTRVWRCWIEDDIRWNEIASKELLGLVTWEFQEAQTYFENNVQQ